MVTPNGTAPVPVEAALRTSEARFHAVWEATDDALALSDADGIVLAANPAYYRLYGLTPAEVLGQSFAVIFPADVRAWAAAEYRRLYSAPELEPSVESVVQRADGTARIVEAHYTFIVEAGVRTAMLSTVRDITARKRAEAERADLLAQEQAARAQAEAALRLRDAFLASISHDLRTPLTTLSGTTQMLQRQLARSGSLSATQATPALAGITHSVRQLRAMVEELLDLAQLDSGQPLALQRTPTDLVALARQVAHDQQQLTKTHRIGVQAESAVLQGNYDAARLERTLANLVGNAVKYSPAGGAVTVRLARVDDAQGRWVELVVRDQGLGIPAADLPRVRERFYRGGNVAGRIEGTGIGLAGATQIVEQHGGTLAIASEEGQGTTVTLRLPLG